MTKTIQQIGLHELTTVRVTCPNCGLVLEMPPMMAGSQVVNNVRCQNCRHPQASGLPDAFSRFALALDQLQKVSQPDTIEFVIPVKSEETK